MNQILFVNIILKISYIILNNIKSTNTKDTLIRQKFKTANFLSFNYYF